MEALKCARRTLAGTKPVFTVCTNALLLDIATHVPQTVAELSRLRGIGPKKLAAYGDEILRICRDAAAATTTSPPAPCARVSHS